MVERLCKNCYQTFTQWASTQNLCGKCAYNKSMALRTKAKPINRIGKKARAWISARKDWIKANPPDHFGMWQCYLAISTQCLGRIDIDQLTIDHVRGRDGELLTEQSNLKPACSYCNLLKGSRSIENLVQEYPHLKEFAEKS